MKQEHPEQTPSQNLIKMVTNGPISKQFMLSDMLLQRFSGLTNQLLSLNVLEMSVLSKKPDQQLAWYKKIGAKILSIKCEHEFLLFEVEEQFFVSVDFYKQNRIKVRMGDIRTVLGSSLAREKAYVVRSGVLEWKVRPKMGKLQVRDIVNYIEQKSPKEYDEISNRGSHFSREMFEQLKYKAN